MHPGNTRLSHPFRLKYILSSPSKVAIHISRVSLFMYSFVLVILRFVFVLIVSLLWVALSKSGFIFFWMNLSILFPLSAPLIWIVKSSGITFLIVLFNGLLVVSKERKVK